jgi:hypothetical protein
MPLETTACYFYSASITSRKGVVQANVQGVIDAVPPTPDTLADWYQDMRRHIADGLDAVLKDGAVLNVVTLSRLD